ncbi:hypothetical protein XI04_18460 [Bradyrhizobium sp. CCBAU 11430]|nr:hypothetical protein [Bradyrhizobium sp. CCBAU 25360]MDA9448715.1 hypothetical protein [Bradyrhizobium sp. CCBAU 21360]MDA9454019.1 hypothetical protein [Bradyrhizobium sp. CCBAU 21359]MDA9515031.1 hypothetical protein [Bradyrhizobium sp. CCBAU 11430]
MVSRYASSATNLTHAQRQQLLFQPASNDAERLMVEHAIQSFTDSFATDGLQGRDAVTRKLLAFFKDFGALQDRLQQLSNLGFAKIGYSF